MKNASPWLVMLLGLALVGVSSSLAQQKPKMPAALVFEQKGESPGKATFSHERHYEQFPKCTECHTKIFKMKRGTTEGPWTMARMEKGELCGTCHTGDKKGSKGQVIFSIKDKNNCTRCHIKA